MKSNDAQVTVKLAPPAPPAIESVTVVLTQAQAVAVVEALGPLPATTVNYSVFSPLIEALRSAGVKVDRA